MAHKMTIQQETERRILLLRQAIELLKEEISERHLSIARIENLIAKLDIQPK